MWGIIYCTDAEFGSMEDRNQMIIEPKKTAVAYRCPDCGAGVMSVVGVFSLSAEMLKLKCSCGHSEMSMVRTSDGKIRFTVPCLLTECALNAPIPNARQGREMRQMRQTATLT